MRERLCIPVEVRHRTIPIELVTTMTNRKKRSPKSVIGALQYPFTARIDQKDNYHGTIVEDPYRWLEDDQSGETHEWVLNQNKVTQSFLGTIPQRRTIRDYLTSIWNYEKYGMPIKRGEKTFFSRNSGMQNQSVLYVIDKPGAQPRVLIDPNTLSEDGTVALSGISISDDGKLIAYSLSASGSDWQTWRVRQIDSGEDLSDEVRWVKFSRVSWLKDGSGFFYSRYDEPKKNDALKGTNLFHKLYFHRLGTEQSVDQLIYKRDDEPEWGFRADVTDDGNYLVISVWNGSSPKQRIYYQDLNVKNSPIVKLIDNFDASYTLIDNQGPLFWFVTDLNATRRRVVAIDVSKCSSEHLDIVELIAESDQTIEVVSLVGERFFVQGLKDARSVVYEYALNGSFIREVNLPGIGSAEGFGGKREDMETYFSFTNMSTPSTIYRYDIATGKSSVHFAPKVGFNPSDFITKQVFYTSKDGTRVPMFVSYRKGLKRNGQNPTYLYGYGGFGISLGPEFSVSILTWMQMGGIFAQACLRGGGEYGEEWHEAGTKLRKQNVFDDFIAAAEYLISEGYTSTPKLAIRGGSNGGLLVGACMTQRPELYGAALPAVGVMDMLRFQRFTIGYAWTSDYGSSDDPNEFKALLAYSPLHNLKQGVSYPATLVTTADHDDRVVPAHSFKFAATLQHCQAGDAPALIRIEEKAGHGAGKPTAKVIEEAADKWGFLFKVLRVPARKLRPLKKS